MNTTPLLELLSVIALKGAVVLIVALLLGLGLRRMAAARRHALWITAIATLAVLPLAMWALPAWRVLPQADAAREWPVMEPPLIIDNASSFLPPEDDSSGGQVSKPALPVPAQAPARPVFSWNISWQDVVDSLPMLWMLVAGLLLLRLGHSAWRLHRLEASLRPGECALVPETARELGLQRLPRLLIGPSDAVPMVWGVLRPRLLLPQGFETWSLEKQRGVLLHELAHLKRGDPLALWAAQWVKALHWFNPLVWLTLRQLRADQERSCDDAVLRHGVRASDYAQSLLDLSRHNRLAPGLSLCALTITRCAPVEARVKAILDLNRSRESLTLRWLLALAGGALLITLPVAMLHAIESTMLRGRILDRHGVVLAESTKEKVRNYPLKTLAAHMVGYISAPDKKHAQIYGRAALEKQHDSELTAGKDVTLTLDMRMQSLAYRAMKEAGVTRGAAVVLDPRTGEILAAVSLPSYDPNLFSPITTQENWDKYISNRDIPLLNRCVKGLVPGSSYKLLTGLAGCAAGISGQKFNCTGLVTYGKNDMQCWKYGQDGSGHGLLGMSESLAVSCNCYWYQFGNEAGIEQIESMGRKIGFGSAYGITEDEDKGVLPGPDWLKEHRPQETWSEGYTANTAIGSGLVLATPLQMAVLAATVGNGGKVPQPGIVKQETPSSWRVDLTQGTLTAAEVEPLREGMRLAVNGDSGTGRPARSAKVVIAGKTGTAQAWRLDANGTKQDDNQGWFIGFAPFDKPTLAFAIVKLGAKTGGGDCGPIAKRIVEEALELPADGSGEVKAVEDQVGKDHEKLQQLQAQFNASTDLLKAAIEGIKPDANTGFALSEITVDQGQLVVRGVASGMIQALQFREKLVKLELLKQLDWTFPVPETMDDGKRVQFIIWGNLWSTKSLEQSASTTEPADQAQIRQQSDDDIRMKPALAREWAKTNAKVIGRSSSASSHSLVIDKGSLDGIVADRSVITLGGVVGKTAAPEPHTTKVILLTDKLCGVSAKVEGTFEQGILAGERAAQAAEQQLRLRFLSRDAKINIGSRVYSSGEGGVFPANQLLGRVKQFNSGDVSGEAIVEPAVDFSTLDEVFVLELKTGAPDLKSSPPSKPAGQAQTRQQADGEIRMPPALAKSWAMVQKAGFLAELPAWARPFDLGDKHPERQMKSVVEFHFSASREDVRRWLQESHCSPAKGDFLSPQPGLLASALMPLAVEDIAADWPVLPQPFQRTYMAANQCQINIHASDGENVTVTVSHRKPTLLIAPEAQPAGDSGKKQTASLAEEARRMADVMALRRQVKEMQDQLRKLIQEKPLNQAAIDELRGGISAIVARFLPPSGPVVHVAASQMPEAESQRWKKVQSSGRLATLTAGAQVKILTKEDTAELGALTQLHFRFSAPREEAHAWLVASLSEKQKKSLADRLDWPEAPLPFYSAYLLMRECQVQLHSTDGQTVHVIATFRQMPLMITPLQRRTSPDTPPKLTGKDSDFMNHASLEAGDLERLRSYYGGLRNKALIASEAKP